MRAMIDVTGDASKDYIYSRIREIQWTKRCEIDSKFKPEYPKNKTEAKKWLKDGYFHLQTGDAEDEEEDYFEFQWGKKVDYKERDAQWSALDKARQNTLDTVSVLTDEQARLKALKDFESFTVH